MEASNGLMKLQKSLPRSVGRLDLWVNQFLNEHKKYTQWR